MGENNLSSVKIIKNSKGTTWVFKAKNDDPYKAMAQEIDKQLRIFMVRYEICIPFNDKDIAKDVLKEINFEFGYYGYIQEVPQ